SDGGHRPDADQLCRHHPDGGLHRQDDRAAYRIGTMIEDKEGPEMAPANDAGEIAGDFPDEGAAAPPEERIAALETELADTKDRLLRALAETENVRRRAQREREDTQKYAVSGFARDLLATADNLRRALDRVPE